MKKTALVLATVGALAVGTIATTTPAQAHWRGGFGWGPGIAGGLLAGAVIGGIATSAYGWGPYGYGYAPAYYGGYYGPYAYAPAYHAPAYGYRYHRVFRPAYAYYGGPYHRWHHRWRHW